MLTIVLVVEEDEESIKEQKFEEDIWLKNDILKRWLMRNITKYNKYNMNFLVNALKKNTLMKHIMLNT
jgi:hypothetical protein